MDIHLRQGELVSLNGVGRSCRVSCRNGAVWVTCQDDSRDYFLNDGDVRSFTVRGKMIVEAWNDVLLTIADGCQQTSIRESFQISMCGVH